MVRHHSGEEVAENIFEHVKDFVSKVQSVGGSYDGAYFHQSLPNFLAEKFEVKEEDVQDDHDWLHKCGFFEKNIRKLDKNDWNNQTASLSAQVFKDFNFGKSHEELREMAKSIDLDFSNPTFHGNTRFANSYCKVFKSFYQDLPALILSYQKRKDEKAHANRQKELEIQKHAVIC